MADVSEDPDESANDTPVVRPAGHEVVAADQGGDAACWLDRVCPECGRIPDSEPGDVCPFCHTPRER